jgi:hypothetical protein
MISVDGRVLPVGALQVDPPRQTVFARPDADSKTSDGRVFRSDEFAVILSGLDGAFQIMISSPVSIDAEFRLFVVASEVVAESE